jgi:hypothetical protein
MLRTCLAFAFFGMILSCGKPSQEEANNRTARSDAASISFPLAKYPTDMPPSPVGDRRLIGYWETVCRPLAAGSALWSFLLDPTKAVLETQLYSDKNCLKATLTGRSYLTFTVDGTTLDAKIWKVSATIHDRRDLISSSDCGMDSLEDDSWYDFTESNCRITNLLSVNGKGAPLIHSTYFIDKTMRGLRFEVPGQGLLQFARQD